MQYYALEGDPLNLGCGSARIIYVDFEIGEKICGLVAYPKSEKANLTEKEKQAIKKLIDTIEPYYNTPDGKEK